MTREDINDIINAICPNDEDYEKPCISPKYLRQELEQLALDQKQWNGEPTTKNDLGVDYISRQEVLRLLASSIGKSNTYLQTEVLRMSSVTPQEPMVIPIAEVKFDKDKLKELVDKAVLTVTPKIEPRWIPVSERKPEKGGEYLLWGKICEDEDDNYCFIGDYHEFDEAFGTEIGNYDPKTLGFIDTEIEEYYSVVAWMPLPTDYCEVEE